MSASCWPRKGIRATCEPGQRIEGLDRVAAECPDVLVFHAGVKEKDGALVTGGGRVMTVVGKGADVRGRDRPRLRRGLARALRRDAVSSRHRAESASKPSARETCSPRSP